MYDKFIDPILRPEWLPESQSQLKEQIDLAISSPSSDLARQHRAAKRKRKSG